MIPKIPSQAETESNTSLSHWEFINKTTERTIIIKIISNETKRNINSNLKKKKIIKKTKTILNRYTF